MKKKVFAISLALILLLGLLPGTAWAAQANGAPSSPTHIHAISVECETGSGIQVSFDHALTSREGKLCIDGEALPTDGSGNCSLPDGHYYLAENITLGHSRVSILANVDLCLNGHTLDLGERMIDISGENGADAHLRVCDCSAGETGSIVRTAQYTDTIMALGDFSLYGGTVQFTGGSASTTAVAVGRDSTTTLYGGRILSDCGDALWYDSSAGGLRLSGTVKLQGGAGADNAEFRLRAERKDGPTPPITITGPLGKPDTPWRVVSAQAQVLTDGWSEHMGDADFNDYFVYIDEERFIEKNDDGELEIFEPQPEHAHTWAIEWSKDKTGHWHDCTSPDCDITEKSEKSGYDSHTSGGWITDKEATANETGSKHKECTICGYITETESIPATGSGGIPPVNPNPPAPDPDPLPADPTLLFTDVNESAWYRDAVAYVTSAGLFQGASQTAFLPGGVMTRSMLATVLHRADGTPDGQLPGFDDVPREQYYTEAVGWAAQRGIITGYNSNSFGPYDPITREQLAVMLWRYDGCPVSSGTTLTFTDADRISDYAHDALGWAVNRGILSGRGGGILDPKGQATRAEVAAVLMRYLG